MLCSFCCFLNGHAKNHNLIDIYNKNLNEENLKLYNISFEKSISEFNEIFNKVRNIKQNIEEEIEKINNSYIKIMEEITASFEEKRFELNKLEKKLKLDLDKKVTEVKEELENKLSKSNNIIISLERINKAIKYYANKNVTNKIKFLYYISEINNYNLKALDFYKKPIRNIDISINLELNAINYKDFYFSGIPIPKNINIEEKEDKIFILWDIDEFRITNYNIKDIEYIVEVKNWFYVCNIKSSEKRTFIEKNRMTGDLNIKIKACIEGIEGNFSENKIYKNEMPNDIKQNPFLRLNNFNSNNKEVKELNNDNPFKFI